MAFVDANPTALTSLGYTKDEFVNLLPADVDAAFDTTTLSKTFDSIVRSKDQHTTLLSKYTRKDKRTYDVEVYLARFKENGQHYLIASATKVSVLTKAQESTTFHSTLPNNTSDANSSTDEASGIINQHTSREKSTSNDHHVRALFEHSFDGMALLSREGVIIDVSPSVEQMVGISKQELVNTIRFYFITPEYAQIADEAFQAVIKEPLVPRSVEYEAVMPTGARRWFECTYSNLLDKPGVNAIVLNFRDITRRKKSEERVRFKANLLNTIGQAVVATDLNGLVTFWNAAAEKIYGWSQEEALGKSIVELTPAQQSREQATEIMEQLKKGESWSGEFRVQRKDGSDFPALVTDSPIYDSHGNLSGIIGVSSDITESKKIEDKLKESEARYRTARTQGKLGHWEWNLANNKVFWSDEIYEMFKVSGDFKDPDLDLFLSCVFPADKRLLLQQVESALADLKGFDLYHRIIVEDGSIRYVHEVADLVQDKHGKPVKFTGMIQDVTEQRLIQEELSLSERNYRFLFNESPLPFWMVDFPTFNFLEVNEAAIKLYGFSKEEFLTMNVRDIRMEEDEAYFKMLNGVYRSGESYAGLTRHKKKNGETVIVKITTKHIIYNGKSVWLATANDITKEMLFEKQLKESQEQLSLIFNSTINSMWLLKIEGNNEYRIEAANDAIAKALSMDKKRLVGFLLHSVFDPSGSKTFLQGYRMAAETGEVQKFIAQTKLDTGERVSDITIIPIKSEEGKVTRLLLVSNDITQQKKFQQKLIESEEKYRVLFEKSPVPMWIFDKQGLDILEVNMAAIKHYGYKKEEFCSLKLHDIKAEAKASRLSEMAAKSSSHTISFNAVHKKKNGNLIKVNVTANSIDYDNKEAGLAVIIDRTGEELAKSDLIKSRNELRTLASHLENIREDERTNIAREIHDELGQQLTGVKMDISWIKRNLGIRDEKVNAKIISALELVDGAITTVRKIATELRPSILDDLGVSEAIDWQAREFATRTGIIVNFTSNVADVKFPPAVSIAIFRIFQEALTNVARHANASAITSSLNKKDNSLVLIIADNGIGFNQTDQKSRKTLGLLGMEERVIALNGKYNISSKRGKGTAVSVQVPLPEDK